MYRDGQYYQYSTYHKPDRNYYYTKHNQNQSPKYDILRVHHDTPGTVTPGLEQEGTVENEADWKREESPKPVRARVLIEHW